MDLLDLGVIVVAIALGAFVKGVTGAGLPQVALPVMAIFLGVETSVVVLVLPGIVANALMLRTYRVHLSASRDLPVLLVGGGVGAALGTWLLTALDQRILAGVLTLLLAGYIAVRLLRPDLAPLAPATTRRLTPPVGTLVGVLQGATGISGPLLTTYLHSYRYPPQVYVAALCAMFQVMALVQAVALVVAGLVTTERLLGGSLAVLPMLLVLPLGVRVARRVSPRVFDRWILALLAASALKLGHSAIWG